jgi:hypothetical protein
MIPDYYVVLGVERSAHIAAIRSAYRKLALLHHPDKGGDVEQFKLITEAHDVLADPDARKRYDLHGSAKPMVVRSKTHTYQVGALLQHGDVSDLYAGEDETGVPVVFKALRNPSDLDLLINEAATLTSFTNNLGARGSRYVPELRDSFMTRDMSLVRRRVNVLARLDGWFTFDAVRMKQPTLRFEHAVWMFNRVLECLGHVHAVDVVHGAVLPTHLLAYASTGVDSPWDHGVKLVDWCYSVGGGNPIQAIAPDWRAFYPPEVFAKKAATAATDIYMAAKCIVHVLGGDVVNMTVPDRVPPYLINFLRGCTLGNPAARPNNAWALLREFKDFMRKHYGPRVYVPFNMPVN